MPLKEPKTSKLNMVKINQGKGRETKWQKITTEKEALSIGIENFLKQLHLRFYRNNSIFSANMKHTRKKTCTTS
jgi:hypothetical protein